MNPKINKIIDEIERSKAKITELQALLPELERKRIDMENSEIVRLVRSTKIALADFPEFLKSIKHINAAVPEAVPEAAPESIPGAVAASAPVRADPDAPQDGTDTDYDNTETTYQEEDYSEEGGIND